MSRTEPDTVPPDDILYEYAPATALKKSAVSALLRSKKYIVIADDPEDGMYWLSGEVPPMESPFVVGTVVNKFFEAHGGAWLKTLIFGILSKLNKSDAVKMLHEIEEELKGR